ncbi:MAG: YdiU family protein, partial [Alcanivoracaceae bacterium]|nr:YdiU family protein [Alcanivoracaceae bacterium]
QLLDGAVLARVASSHIRVGTFQYFAARHEQDKVKLLADYTIKRHFPELAGIKNPYLGLLRSVRDRQAALIAQWVLVGFVHGVMNTDNMAISGETIDFGPCAFIDNYDANASFSSIDRKGRYALGKQPYMAQWNTARFAETLLPLLDDDKEKSVEIATEEIQAFNRIYQNQWLKKVTAKLGLVDVEAGDLELANDLFEMMQGQNVDFTQFFRGLSDAAKAETQSAKKLFDDPQKFDQWYKKWMQRFLSDSRSLDTKIESMNAVNPIYIARNHLVEEALQAAEQDNDFKPFERLLTVLASPYDERTGLQKYANPAPKEFGPYKTFCGT